jgi:hypothetical protein
MTVCSKLVKFRLHRRRNGGMLEEVDPDNAGYQSGSDRPFFIRTRGKWQEGEGQKTCNSKEGINVENI